MSFRIEIPPGVDPAVFIDESSERYALSSVFFDATSRCLVSTDGRSLAWIPVRVEGQVDGGDSVRDLLIDGVELRRALRMARREKLGSLWCIDVTGDQAVLRMKSNEGPVFRLPLFTDRRYPPWKDVIEVKTSDMNNRFTASAISKMSRLARQFGDGAEVTIDLNEDSPHRFTISRGNQTLATCIIMSVRDKEALR